MNRKKLFGILGVACIGILAVFLAVYLLHPPATKPSWLALNDFTIYEQRFTWAGHNATEYMFWNVTAIRGGLAEVHLVSHGVNVSDGLVSFPRGEINVTVDMTSLEVVALSDTSYSNEMPIGSKWPFWIPNSVKAGDAVETLYGDSVISPSQSIDVMGKSRDCWRVSYAWQYANMDRFYDRASGICLKIQTSLLRNGISVTIVETAVQTNINSL